MVLVPCSVGDALDRLSILAIKKERIADASKAGHVAAEYDAIRAAVAGYLQVPELNTLLEGLRGVNELLWDVEDAIRDHERLGNFGVSFVQLARRVYVLNDHRADIKRQVNELSGSELVEVKSYASYIPKPCGAP